MGQLSEEYIERITTLDNDDDPLPAYEWVISPSSTEDDRRDFASRLIAAWAFTKARRRVDREIESKAHAYNEWRSFPKKLREGFAGEKLKEKLCKKYDIKPRTFDYAISTDQKSGDRRVRERAAALLLKKHGI